MMEQVESLKTNAFDNYHLRFFGQNLNAKYGCSVFFDDGKSQNEIRYKLDIVFNGDLDNGIKKYTINRENKIYVNDVIQNNFIDILALETSKCLYPLEIKTNTYGEFLEILNFEDILNRWKETKENLKENYKSSLTNKYIKATNKSLLSKEVLLTKIRKDWFINLYFNSLYKFYSEDFYINEKLSYPIISGIKPVEYQVTSKIKLNKDSNDIRLDINGVIDDERCALDLEQGLDNPHFKELNINEKPLLGSCNLIYLFEENTGVIEAIEAEYETKLSIPKKILVKMFLLKQLDSKNSFVVEDEKQDKKSGFWSKLFKK